MLGIILRLIKGVASAQNFLKKYQTSDQNRLKNTFDRIFDKCHKLRTFAAF